MRIPENIIKIINGIAGATGTSVADVAYNVGQAELEGVATDPVKRTRYSDAF